jgi:hypothetical protein
LIVQRCPPADGAEVRRSADLERNAYEGRVCKVVYLRRDVNDRRSCSLGSSSTRVCCRIFTTSGLGRAGGLRVLFCLRGGIFIATCPSAYGWLRGRDNFSLVPLVMSPRIPGGIAVMSLRSRSCLRILLFQNKLQLCFESLALFLTCASWWWRM